MKKIYLFVGFWVALVSANAQNVADFENIQLDSASYWNGEDGSGGFNSGGFFFPNDYNQEWGSWSGFSVSNMNDSITAGWENQYSAIAAIGAEQSENYAVVYVNSSQQMAFDTPVQLDGFHVTNATYAYLSMKNGDDLTKKFGGAEGTDPDYFKLIVFGFNDLGNKTDSVEFYLADFRSQDSEEDYIVRDWQWLDLTELGTVSSITFELESTDIGDWGMNTPAYFCMDNFSGSSTTSVSLLKNIDLNIYPNPVERDFIVESSEEINELVVSDNSGRIVLHRQLSGERSIRITSLENMPGGIYFLKIISENGFAHQKIVKM